MNNQIPQDAHYTQLHTLLQPLLEDGTSGLKAFIELAYNTVMLFQREDHLKAHAYERSPERIGMANGFKHKGLLTPQGRLDLKVPQTRNTNFYPPLLEKGQRTDNAFISTIAEMYIQGVSTRKIHAILQEMCDCNISSSQVSRFNATLDQSLKAWNERPIGEVLALIIDARYEKVRLNQTVVDCALFVAYGITPDGHRRVSVCDFRSRSPLARLLQ